MRGRSMILLFAAMLLVLVASWLMMSRRAEPGEASLVVDLRGAAHGRTPIQIVNRTSRTAVEVRLGAGTFPLEPVVGPGETGRLPFPVTSKPCEKWTVSVRFDDGGEATGAVDPCVIRSIRLRDEIAAD